MRYKSKLEIEPFVKDIGLIYHKETCNALGLMWGRNGIA